MVAKGAFAAFVLLATIYFSWSKISHIFSSWVTWSIIVIVFCIYFTSGYMWVRIRNPPYRGNTLVADGFQNQFGAETHITALICKVFVDGLV